MQRINLLYHTLLGFAMGLGGKIAFVWGFFLSNRELSFIII